MVLACGCPWQPDLCLTWAAGGASAEPCEDPTLPGQDGYYAEYHGYHANHLGCGCGHGQAQVQAGPQKSRGALERSEVLQREVGAAGVERTDGAVGEEKGCSSSLWGSVVCPDGREEWWWVEGQMAVFLSQVLELPPTPTTHLILSDLTQCQHLSQT